MTDTWQVFFGNASVTLSPYRFALAETLFKSANTTLTDTALYLSARSAPRPATAAPGRDVRRLIDANLALLAHVLELDGSHGYRLKRCLPAGYCLESELSASSQLSSFIGDVESSDLAALELDADASDTGLAEERAGDHVAH